MLVFNLGGYMAVNIGRTPSEEAVCGRVNLVRSASMTAQVSGMVRRATLTYGKERPTTPCEQGRPPDLMQAEEYVL